MRHRVQGSRQHLRRWQARVLAPALFATVALSIAGCSDTTATQASAPGQEAPTSDNGVAAATLLRSKPLRLRIAAIGVNSSLMPLGLRSDGTMQVPPGGFPAGWYTGGPTPGELGPAVIAGHVDTRGPGVFYRLHKVTPGDLVNVTRADGSTPVFRVKRVGQYPKNQFPTELVYGNLDHAGLRLITCGGTFNRQSRHYDDNIVVFADLVAPQG